MHCQYLSQTNLKLPQIYAKIVNARITYKVVLWNVFEITFVNKLEHSDWLYIWVIFFSVSKYR